MSLAFTPDEGRKRRRHLRSTWAPAGNAAGREEVPDRSRSRARNVFRSSETISFVKKRQSLTTGLGVNTPGLGEVEDRSGQWVEEETGVVPETAR